MPRYVIGLAAPRSGTSFCARQWGRHPDISMPGLKETHYWDDLDVVRGFTGRPIMKREAQRAGKHDRVRQLEEVEALASPQEWKAYLDRNGGEVRAEYTPNYMGCSYDRLAQMCDTLGEVSFVALLREPAARAMSQCRKRGATEADFLHELVAKFSDYEDLFAKLDKLGRPVTVAFTEALFKDASAFDAIWDGIGVARRPVDVGEEVNRSGHARPDEETQARLWVRFARQRDYMRERFPETAELWA